MRWVQGSSSTTSTRAISVPPPSAEDPREPRHHPPAGSIFVDRAFPAPVAPLALFRLGPGGALLLGTIATHLALRRGGRAGELLRGAGGSGRPGRSEAARRAAEATGRAGAVRPRRST